MTKRKYIRIKVEHQLIVLGQIGNLHSKINDLRYLLVVANLENVLPYLDRIEEELAILEKYFPPLSKDFPQFRQLKSEDGNS